MDCADPVIFSLFHPSRPRTLVATPLRSPEVRSEVAHRWEMHRNQADTPKGSKSESESEFAQHFNGVPLSEDLDSMLHMLWEFPSDQLSKCLEHMGDRSCVSLQRVADTRHREYKKGSVEFRYLEGMLHPELILRFSKLMVAMFQFVDNANPKTFFKAGRAVPVVQGERHRLRLGDPPRNTRAA